VWNGGHHSWYRGYAAQARSYRLSARARTTLGNAIDVLVIPPQSGQRLSAKTVAGKLPRRVGRLRNSPEF